MSNPAFTCKWKEYRASEAMSSEDENHDDESGVNASFKWVLVIFPAGIFILGFVSIVYYLNGGFDPEDELVRSEREVEAKRIAGLVDNLRLYSPERGLGSEDARLGLRRIFKMYESSLGERNAGYDVVTSKGFPVAGELWPLLSISIEPRSDEAGYHVLALSATESAATHATVLAVLEAIASNREAETGLLFVLFPTAAGGEFDQQQLQRLTELVEGKSLRQVLILENLDLSRRIGYSGKILGSGDWLAPGMTEGIGSNDSAGVWQRFFGDAAVASLSSGKSDQKLDSVAQAEVARELEGMVRRLTGL